MMIFSNIKYQINIVYNTFNVVGMDLWEKALIFDDILVKDMCHSIKENAHIQKNKNIGNFKMIDVVFESTAFDVVTYLVQTCH